MNSFLHLHKYFIAEIDGGGVMYLHGGPQLDKYIKFDMTIDLSDNNNQFNSMEIVTGPPLALRMLT